MWTKEQVHQLYLKQKEFFMTGKTLDVKFRKEALKNLKKSVLSHQKDMSEALHADLGRAETEAYFCDIGTVLFEIDEAVKGVKKWAKPETHFAGLAAFPATKAKVYKMPYGTTLIVSPFNFPFLLSLGVLTAALAGGNTAVLKASSKSKACTEVLKKIVGDAFQSEYVAVVDGGHDVADFCLEERFDKIFYTGSPRVGMHVMEKASANLTPIALELGGENGNWAIVRKDADLKDAARKIAFFKAANSGQICIDVNQVAVAKEVAGAFVEELKKAFKAQLGDSPLTNPEYPHLIGKKAYDACAEEAELYKDRIVYGGKGDEHAFRFEPTIIYPVKENETIVNHELFNPLLPIVPFDDEKADKLLQKISQREHGLALYLFTKDRRWAEKVMSTQQYGGGCVNEVCNHLIVKGVPFNGTGHSGMGAYHGIWGFREFTHPSTVLYGRTKFNLPLREHPYSERKLKILKNFLK